MRLCRNESLVPNSLISDVSAREAVSAWTDSLRAQHPTLLFRSSSAFLPSVEPLSTKDKGKERADNALGLDPVLSLLGEWAQEKTSDEPLLVAVIGVTNVRLVTFLINLIFDVTSLGRQELILELPRPKSGLPCLSTQ